jgi:hypothetical protein
LPTRKTQGAELTDGGKRIAIKVTRYISGKHVLDSDTVPARNVPLHRPRRTAFHIRVDSELLAQLDAAGGEGAAFRPTSRRAG